MIGHHVTTTAGGISSLMGQRPTSQWLIVLDQDFGEGFRR